MGPRAGCRGIWGDQEVRLTVGGHRDPSLLAPCLVTSSLGCHTVGEVALPPKHRHLCVERPTHVYARYTAHRSTHVLARSHPRKHTCAHPHARTHPRMHTHKHVYTQGGAHTHRRTSTYMYAHPCAQAHKCLHGHSHTQMHAHALTIPCTHAPTCSGTGRRLHTPECPPMHIHNLCKFSERHMCAHTHAGTYTHVHTRAQAFPRLLVKKYPGR